MADPLITLTTDFGERSPYVAAMKGVILSINPSARLIDLSHQIRPQDLYHASYFLGSSVPYFPDGTIHVAVIDPGVGTERIPLLARAGGQYLVGPDNGIFTGALDHLGDAACRRLCEPRFWRDTISSTFHGRDIFAPVAAHLSMGVNPGSLGSHTDWLRLNLAKWARDGNSISGAVQFIDDFGNLITNIPAGCIGASLRAVFIDGRPLADVRQVRTYGEAPPGSLVVLASSDGFVEVARVNGNAAQVTTANVGALVELQVS